MSESAGVRPLCEGHRDRLRHQMEREGWDSLRPYEMVELVLFHAVPRQDVSDIARVLVDRFGSVGGVFEASREQLSELPEVTPAMAEWIALTGEMMRAYYDVYSQTGIRLSCYQEVRSFLARRRFPRDGTGMWAIYVDFDFNLITLTDFKGDSPWWDAANARRMLGDAICSGARYVILMLRRESAAAGMRAEERTRLEAIAATLRCAGMDLVDCLLADADRIFSMNLNGQMDAIRANSGCAALYERYGSGKPQI